MLILSRKKGQVIRIGDNIVITVVAASGTIKLGFEAPRDVLIRRDGVVQKTPVADTSEASDTCLPQRGAP